MLKDHEGEVSKVIFNPQGTKLFTGGSDHIGRLWDVETGKMLQKLEGHED